MCVGIICMYNSQPRRRRDIFRKQVCIRCRNAMNVRYIIFQRGNYWSAQALYNILVYIHFERYSSRSKIIGVVQTIKIIESIIVPML